jgi:hypothetical protein
MGVVASGAGTIGATATGAGTIGVVASQRRFGRQRHDRRHGL